MLQRKLSRNGKRVEKGSQHVAESQFCKYKGSCMIIRNENDIYIYFETITQLEPQKILDVGMFLKRVGSVARKAMDGEVPEEIKLDGVDLFPEVDFPVWKQVYSEIFDKEEFLSSDKTRAYDLAVALGTEEMQKRNPFSELAEVIKDSACYLLTDARPDTWGREVRNAQINDLHVEQDTYYLINFGA